MTADHAGINRDRIRGIVRTTAIIVVKTFFDVRHPHGFTLFAWWRVIVGTLGLVALAMGK